MKLKSLLTGVVVLASGAGLAFYATQASDVEYSVVKPQLVAPEGGTQALACSDGLHRLVEGGTPIENVDQQISGWAGILYVPSTPNETAPKLAWTPFNQRDIGFENGVIKPAHVPGNALGTPTLDGSVLLERNGEGIGNLMGTSMHRAYAGDLRGLASNPCQWSDNSTWLVGSNGTVGTSNRLTVTNPGVHPIQVNIDAFTSVGKAELGANKYINIAPKSSKSLALDGIVPSDPRIALHLSADSGTFTASLQTSQLEGYKPKGVDFIKPGVSGRKVLVNGLHLPAGKNGPDPVIEAQVSNQSELVDPHYKASLRIANAENSIRTVSIKVMNHDGELSPLPGGENITIAPSAVLDLNLDGLKPGDYSVVVDADGEVSAGALVTSNTDSGESDGEWLAARPAFNNGGAAIGNMQGRLIITASADTTATWTAFKEDGSKIESHDVSVHGIQGIDLPGGTAYVTLAAGDSVYASVAAQIDISGVAGIDWIPLTSNTFDSSSVRISTRN
ncbi:DUF5719 family protein [Arcanobacterium ihumii]|uniref:DUF5719 family protein n=1 Tax=Arcanobacterium ihumii TaxID=2138162 RepID=UPI000F538AA5|nr:DUF5719 family protein [Arcanobacterium ihumii]